MVLESGFQGLGIRNPTKDWNAESKLHCQWLTVAGIQYLDLESAAWNCLGFPCAAQEQALGTNYMKHRFEGTAPLCRMWKKMFTSLCNREYLIFMFAVFLCNFSASKTAATFRRKSSDPHNRCQLAIEHAWNEGTELR